jgi:hypothetical protein
MAWHYEHLPGQNAESLAAWLSESTEIERFALIDVQRLDAEQMQALDGNRWGVAVNLYGDLAGTGIAALGPRLLRLPSDEIPNMIQLALATRAVSFLLGKCDQSTLSAHLQSIREVELPDRTAALFRYQDIHVTSALFPVLPAADSGRCLGPLSAWGALDACNTLHVIAATSDKRVSGSLHFDQKTVEALDDSLFVHAAMAQANDVDSALLAPYTECEAETLVRQRIEMAKKLGLEQRDDIALYCVLSLQFPPGFEKEAPFAEALRFRERNKPSFGATLDEVPSEAWTRWDERLKDSKEIE